VDVAHQDLRWNLPSLIKLASGFEPSLGKLAHFAEIIPYQIASTNPDELCYIDDDESQELLRTARMEKAAALRDSHEVEGVLVHCHAGISRSAAVAKWIAEKYELPYPERYMLYNKHVYRTLREAMNRRLLAIGHL